MSDYLLLEAALGAAREQRAVQLVDVADETLYGVAFGNAFAARLAHLGPQLRIGGQPREPLRQRIDIARRHDGGLVVVATHGAVIRAVVNHVSPDTEAHAGIPIRNGSIHSFASDGGDLVLREFDDPIEVESERPGTFDFDYQNALESEAGGRD